MTLAPRAAAFPSSPVTSFSQWALSQTAFPWWVICLLGKDRGLFNRGWEAQLPWVDYTAWYCLLEVTSLLRSALPAPSWCQKLFALRICLLLPQTHPLPLQLMPPAEQKKGNLFVSHEFTLYTHRACKYVYSMFISVHVYYWVYSPSVSMISASASYLYRAQEFFEVYFSLEIS